MSVQPKITEATIRSLTTTESYSRGEGLIARHSWKYSLVPGLRELLKGRQDHEDTKQREDREARRPRRLAPR